MQQALPKKLAVSKAARAGGLLDRLPPVSPPHLSAAFCRPSRRTVLALMLSIAASGPAAAHHGWAWTEDEPFELTGVIEEIYVGNPHVTLKVSADDGLWHVDLAPLGPTTRAGFDEGAARVGDQVTCIGFRSRDHAERSMKAARVVVNGKTYDVYPNRVPGA